MPISAIFMLVFGSAVLYGGLGFCLYKAVKAAEKKESEKKGGIRDE